MCSSPVRSGLERERPFHGRRFMKRRRIPLVLGVVVWTAVALGSSVTLADDEAAIVNGLLADLKDADFERAVTAAQRLAQYPRQRARIVPALMAAIKTGDWPRCGGDMRDAVARALVELKAKEAVVPLLELAGSGRTIDHECVE
jgi:HEAT repeat protein